MSPGYYAEIMYKLDPLQANGAMRPLASYLAMTLTWEGGCAHLKGANGMAVSGFGHGWNWVGHQ